MRRERKEKYTSPITYISKEYWCYIVGSSKYVHMGTADYYMFVVYIIFVESSYISADIIITKWLSEVMRNFAFKIIFTRRM